jgi:SAM-dependent methyltransferase
VNEYLEANRKLWDSWVPIHVGSEFYDVEAFRRGGISLDRLELEAAGDVAGKSLLHLQCHFGKDTISFARLGASATGADFSPAAISQARRLAGETGVPARFVESEVTALPDHLDGRFDVVFTSNGVIGWLPDLRPWGRVIAHFLASGGRFAIVEGHPVMFAFDDDDDDDLNRTPRPQHRYFATGEPLTFAYRGTYADFDADVDSVEHGWPHSMADVLSALLDAGLRIESFAEHPVLAWKAFRCMERDDEGFWRLPPGVGEIPLSFSLVARKP